MGKKLKNLLAGLLVIVALLMLGGCFGELDATETDPLAGVEIYILDEEDKLYAGSEFYLEIGCNNPDLSINQNNLNYRIIENNADAELDGRRLKVKKEGTVTVQAYGTQNGKEFTSKNHTFTVHGPEAIVNVEVSENGAKVGDRLRLSYTIMPSSMQNTTWDSITYQVISGNGTIEQDGSRFYLVPQQEGEIQLRLNLKNSQTEMTADTTLTVLPRTFTISVDDAVVYVGRPIDLIANSMDMNDFNHKNVTYLVLSGDATITDGVLTVAEAGSVSVQAKYSYNGVLIQSEILQLEAIYDGKYISTVEELKALSNSSENYNLAADLDLSAYGNWTPIENFTGTLRGFGHSITGLQVNATSLQENRGLFATLTGTVEDLTIQGTINATGEAYYIGLLCGKSTGAIHNVSVSGTIIAQDSSYVGGVVGWAENAEITDCNSSVVIWGMDNVGGIAGRLTAKRSADIPVRDNTNTGNIAGTSNVGGVFGYVDVYVERSDVEILLVRNNNSGMVSASGDNVGGVAGYASGEKSNGTAWVEFNDCTNTGEVSGMDKVGGIVGNGGDYLKEVAFCQNTQSVTGNLYVGGYVGYASGAAIRNLKNSSAITGKAWIGGIAGYCGQLYNCSNSGSVSNMGYHLDTDNNALSYMGGIAGYAAGAQNCENNVDITGRNCGNYVGGIVGYLCGTRSEDTTLFYGNKNNGNVSGENYVGGVFGYFTVNGTKDTTLTVTVNSNSNDGAVSGEDYVGGVIGYGAGESHYYDLNIATLKITACNNSGMVSGNDYVGGIVGSAPEYVTELSLGSNTGDVSGNLYVGGYAGYAKGTTMRNLSNSNTIDGKAYLGGIAGWCGDLDSCTNTGTIISNGYYLTDGTTPLSYVGGIAGYATSAKNCENYADIDVAEGGNYVAGIAGYVAAKRTDDNRIFSGNKNHGIITGNDYVGGIYGYFAVNGDESTTLTVVIQNCSNDGNISGKNHVGGILGYGAGEHHYYDWYIATLSIVDCTNASTVSGEDCVGGILGSGGGYVVTEDVAWRTNSSVDDIVATGDNKGTYYGVLN